MVRTRVRAMIRVRARVRVRVRAWAEIFQVFNFFADLKNPKANEKLTKFAQLIEID